MKKKSHETRVLVVFVLTSKWKLRIPSEWITPIQTNLVAQVPSQFLILEISPLLLFLFFLFFENI